MATTEKRTTITSGKIVVKIVVTRDGSAIKQCTVLLFFGGHGRPIPWFHKGRVGEKEQQALLAWLKKHHAGSVFSLVKEAIVRLQNSTA